MSKSTYILFHLFKKNYYIIVIYILYSENIMIDKIKYILTQTDVLITSGSVSMGDRDMLKSILQHYFNATIHFGNIIIKVIQIIIFNNNYIMFKNLNFRSCKYETRETDYFCNMLFSK